jgi:hypothetical protein
MLTKKTKKIFYIILTIFVGFGGSLFALFLVLYELERPKIYDLETIQLEPAMANITFTDNIESDQTHYFEQPFHTMHYDTVWFNSNIPIIIFKSTRIINIDNISLYFKSQNSSNKALINDFVMVIRSDNFYEIQTRKNCFTFDEYFYSAYQYNLYVDVGKKTYITDCNLPKYDDRFFPTIYEPYEGSSAKSSLSPYDFISSDESNTSYIKMLQNFFLPNKTQFSIINDYTSSQSLIYSKAKLIMNSYDTAKSELFSSIKTAISTINGIANNIYTLA